MFRVVVVCNAPLKPYENFYRCPETELGLLWTYTEEEHCKKGQGQKDCFPTGGMWIEMGSSQEPGRGIFLLNSIYANTFEQCPDF